MSLQHAQAFISKMKSDNMFSKAILSAGDVGERLSIEDIESLQTMCIDPSIPNSNLPLSYQCKGPCHSKCAAKVA
jgi:hypothetical protein